MVNTFDRLVTEELQAWMEKADRPGKRHSALAMCKDEYLDVETIAFLGTKAIVNTVAMRGREDKLTRTALAFAIAERIHDELRLRWFRDNKFMMLSVSCGRLRIEVFHVIGRRISSSLSSDARSLSGVTRTGALTSASSWG